MGRLPLSLHSPWDTDRAIIQSEADRGEHNIISDGVLLMEVLAPERFPCYLSCSFAF